MGHPAPVVDHVPHEPDRDPVEHPVSVLAAPVAPAAAGYPGQARPGRQIKQNDRIRCAQAYRQGVGVVAVQNDLPCCESVPLRGDELFGRADLPVRVVVQLVQVHHGNPEDVGQLPRKDGLARPAGPEHQDALHLTDPCSFASPPLGAALGSKPVQPTMLSVVGSSLPDVTTTPNDDAPTRLLDLLSGIVPGDDLERDHLDRACSWAASGADLYRLDAIDVPPTHLVVYAVPLTPDQTHLLLVAHRKAGLWLPPGGHVEPGEDPWTTVVREAAEELHLAAQPLSAADPARSVDPTPTFVTVTRTRGPHPHVDVSLWYPLEATPEQITSWDAAEFTAVRWWPFTDLRRHLTSTAAVDFEPHLARFLDKLAAESS